jgi:diguanylate cyclase (GGDEF)-like protein
MAHSQTRVPSFIQIGRRVVGSIVKHPALLTSLLVAGFIVGIRSVGGLESSELLAYDQMIRLRPDRPADPRLLVVTITEADIRSQKRWPISDAVIAELIEKLQAHQPRTIGLDIYRDVPHSPGESALAKQLQAPNLIAIMLMGNADKDAVPAPDGVLPNRVGISDIVVDPDAVVRRNLMYATVKGKAFYSFSLQLALHYLANQRPLKFEVVPSEAIKVGKTVFPALNPDAGGYQHLDDRGYQVLLDYRSAYNVARQVSLTEVLNGQVDPAWVKDKLVIIGTTAPSTRDLFLTPYNLSNAKSPEMPGVVVHAQMASQILSTVLDGYPLTWFWWQEGEILWIVAWSCAGGLLGWRFRHPLTLGIGGVAAIAGLFGVCFILFLSNGWIPFVPAAIAFVSSSVAAVAYRLLYDALHDELTGLPNRALFIQRLQWSLKRSPKKLNQSLEEPAGLAVLLLGLDGFKTINESLGHQRADQLLVAIAQRLQACLRSHDELARVGGDEFAILLRPIRDKDEVGHLAEHLQKQLKLPFNLDGQDIFTTASMGIVWCPANHTYQPEEVLRDAHTAMNQAKASGKARYQMFISGMRVQVMTRMQLEVDLRGAIDRQEFQLHYQPFICLETGKIAGFEALLRWQHPQRGFVHPLEFIPVAEETDLIIPIGAWVIEEACRQLKIWQRQFPRSYPLVVSVNLSIKQFAQPDDLVSHIERTLKDTDIDGHYLKLEITESIAMTNVETTITLLLRLKALNLQLSIDDFGTGYSSLSYLHRFPTDTIKIDRSFVSRMGLGSEDGHIVKTIITLGHNLDMYIVAEGVETAEQLAQLRSLQCEYGQGYFFAKPLPPETAEALLKSDPQW